MVVRFTTTCAISTCHHLSCEFESHSWRDVKSWKLLIKKLYEDYDKKLQNILQFISENFSKIIIQEMISIKFLKKFGFAWNIFGENESWLTIMSCYCSSLSWIVLAWEVRTVEYLINDQSENGIQVLHCSNMYKICMNIWSGNNNNFYSPKSYQL